MDCVGAAAWASAALRRGGEGVDAVHDAVERWVREFPVRVKCTNLLWHTLHTALDNTDRKVTPE